MIPIYYIMVLWGRGPGRLIWGSLVRVPQGQIHGLDQAGLFSGDSWGEKSASKLHEAVG